MKLGGVTTKPAIPTRGPGLSSDGGRRPSIWRSAKLLFGARSLARRYKSATRGAAWQVRSRFCQRPISRRHRTINGMRRKVGSSRSDLLLDTCAVLWLAEGAELGGDARKAVSENKLNVSPITVWEIANLVRKKRIVLAMSVTKWFR